MAKKKTSTEVEEVLDEVDPDLDEDLDEDLDDDVIEDLDDVIDDLDVDVDIDDDDEPESPESGGGKADQDEETTEALEELETQELQLLEEEKNDNLLVDEVEELRAIRREELTMNVDTQSQRSDEFVCQSCFMVKRTSQLANKRKKLCADCAG